MRQRLWLSFILLVGAALRLLGLNNQSPPGLEHDEVAHWLINRAILEGQHAVYFTEAYGHEAGFHYWQTLFVALLGDNALALRLPAVFLGLLLIPVVYTLACRLFDRPVALMAAALLAVVFYPVFYSRLGLRAISLPLVAGLSLYFFWQGLAPGRAPRRALLSLGLAGILAGLSLHTYMASRSLPIFYALFCLYLAWRRPAWLRSRWGALALFWVLFALVALPLVWFLWANPGAEFRINEVRAPLDALLAGDLGPALTNTLRILGLFGWRGDPLWRQNVAPQPVFEPLTALLFYAGLGLCLWRWREPRFALLLLWLSTAAIPSIVTIDAPSSIRICNSLVVLTVLPALSLRHLTVIPNWWSLSPETRQLSPGRRWSPPWIASLVTALFGLLILLNIGRTSHYLFTVWPANQEVAFVWQTALTRAAAYLDGLDRPGNVAIGGWTPATMDPPTMTLTLRRRDLSLRYFQPQRAVILPGSATAPAEAAPVRLLFPTILPLEPRLAQALRAAGSTSTDHGDFTEITLPGAVALSPRQPVDARFGAEIRLRGYDLTAGCAAGGPCELLTYWEVIRPPDGPRRLFFHLLDPAGVVLAQDDGLDAPPAHWQAGDVVLQRLSLNAPVAGAGNGDRVLRLGVYDPLTGRRLLLPDGADAWPLAP